MRRAAYNLSCLLNVNSVKSWLKDEGSMVATSMCSERGAAAAVPTAADRLFDALDERWITPGPNGRLVEVLGIHATPEDAWVQIALVGESTQSVILHLPLSASIDQAIAALNAWCDTPTDHRPRLIHVTSSAGLRGRPESYRFSRTRPH